MSSCSARVLAKWPPLGLGCTLRHWSAVSRYTNGTGKCVNPGGSMTPSNLLASPLVNVAVIVQLQLVGGQICPDSG